MLIAFLDNEGIICKEFVPPAQTVNVVFYEEVLKRLLQRIRRVRPDLHVSGKWVLVHDNAPAQTTICIHQSLFNTIWPPSIILHAHLIWYGLIFLFPRLKSVLKGARFSEVNDIQGSDH